MKKIDVGLHYPIDFMSLPGRWMVDYVGEFLTSIQPGFACGRHNLTGEGIAHLRPMNVSRDGRVDLSDLRFVSRDADDRRLNVDDVLFNNTNSPELIGKTAYVGVEARDLAFSNHMTRMQFNAAVNPKFAALQLHFLWMMKYFLHRCLKHVNQASVSSGDLARTVALLVPPLSEQHRIVAKIEELFSELDKGVESLNAAREQLKVYRLVTLTHAFEGKLTEEWRKTNKRELKTAELLDAHIRRERDTHYEQQLKNWEEREASTGRRKARPRPPKPVSPLPHDVQNGLPELPKTWAWHRLGWMTCGVEYGTAAKSSERGRIPVIRMGNLQGGSIDWTDLVFTSDDEEICKYSLSAGDVLFNRTNSPELVGKTAMYRGERPALFAGYLIRVNQIPSIVEAQYLNLFLNSHLAKRHGNSIKTDGVNQSNINGQKLQEYPFPYCSLSEQKEVVRLLDEKLSLIDRALIDIDSELSKADALRQSILKKAFSGQLVAQDPRDEPATLLLERIKAERDSDTNSRRKKNANTKEAA